jgi:hypothetical protein
MERETEHIGSSNEHDPANSKTEAEREATICFVRDIKFHKLITEINSETRKNVFSIQSRPREISLERGGNMNDSVKTF